jgi:hypothetical protein
VEEGPGQLRLVVNELQEGYPRLAGFIASDPNFAIYRNPGDLRNRLLLWRQARLKKLEARLNAMDEEDAKDDPYILQSEDYDNTREDADHRRDELFLEIEEEMRLFGEVPSKRTLVSP